MTANGQGAAMLIPFQVTLDLCPEYPSFPACSRRVRGPSLEGQRTKALVLMEAASYRRLRSTKGGGRSLCSKEALHPVSGRLTRAWRIAGEPAAQVGRSRQQRGTIVGADALRQTMHEQIELVQDGEPIAAAGNRRGHQRRADRYPDRGADFVAELADQE
jgi:hypothetical protein